MIVDNTTNTNQYVFIKLIYIYVLYKTKENKIIILLNDEKRQRVFNT